MLVISKQSASLTNYLEEFCYVGFSEWRGYKGSHIEIGSCILNNVTDLSLSLRDQIITYEKVDKVTASILANHLLDKLFGLLDLKFREHLVFNVPILKEEVLRCCLLHKSKASRDVDTSLLNLSLNVTISD